MAVPKKRTSKAKTNKRKTAWKAIAMKQAVKAYSLSKWTPRTKVSSDLPEDVVD
uniref:Ribosomal protein L32 n=1 Tax=Capsosiphon fulvescens TaxID=205396 RepID=A0A3P8MUM5_9CHLO|nr:ribosomal protein L32 [Capsosiphon fulvescens]AWX64090.1 ribosomal protein L32 [Capsosiphon fulvescens]